MTAENCADCAALSSELAEWRELQEQTGLSPQDIRMRLGFNLGPKGGWAW